MTREEQIIKASHLYAKALQKPSMDGALWADKHPQNFWHDAHGDILPDIDREVIVLCDNGKVCFGHRPYEYVAGVSYDGKMTYLEAKTYGKGEWNIPDVKWWLDVELPNIRG